MKNILFVILSIIVITACTSVNSPTVAVENWGSINSEPVYLYTLTNSNGVAVKITNYGCTVVEYHVPDKNGQLENIVLGMGSLDDYLGRHPCFGCIVGRCANRISGAKFTLDGVEYTLAANSGRNHIHGGIENFSRKVWDATTSYDKQSATLSLRYVSNDMEEGYPGNLIVKMDYVLNNDNELQLFYTATTDKPTVLNLTNHSYFNLSGGKEDIRSHQVRIYADKYTPTGEGLIPTGEIAPVDETPYDLRQWTILDERLSLLANGFDNNYCVNGSPDRTVLAAEMYDPKSGRLMQVYTTEPGMQFYTAVRLSERNKSQLGIASTSYMGACFETQHYPDSPNNPNFPSTILRPGEIYMQVTTYKVSIK